MTIEPDATKTDAQLVAALERRDQRALEELYQRYVPVVLGLARRVLNDQSMAEEVVQEVFLRLWNEPRRFDATRGTLKGFLARQAHSRSVDRIRSEEARRRREERYERESVAVAPVPDQEVWGNVRAEGLREALGRLSEGEREAIALAYFGGHSYREVATRLQLPEGTIKSRIRLGLGKLSTSLEAMGLEAQP